MRIEAVKKILDIWFLLVDLSLDEYPRENLR